MALRLGIDMLSLSVSLSTQAEALRSTYAQAGALSLLSITINC